LWSGRSSAFQIRHRVDNLPKYEQALLFMLVDDDMPPEASALQPRWENAPGQLDAPKW
jgi:hypothetical protein